MSDQSPEPSEPLANADKEPGAIGNALPLVEVAPAEPVVASQPRNPLHGVTLEAIVEALAGHLGWEGLAEQIPIRCFASDPSVASSLKFLRKTPWAREKVEGLYLFLLRDTRRSAQASRGSDRPPAGRGGRQKGR